MGWDLIIGTGLGMGKNQKNGMGIFFNKRGYRPKEMRLFFLLFFYLDCGQRRQGAAKVGVQREMRADD